MTVSERPPTKSGFPHNGIRFLAINGALVCAFVGLVLFDAPETSASVIVAMMLAGVLMSGGILAAVYTQRAALRWLMPPAVLVYVAASFLAFLIAIAPLGFNWDGPPVSGGTAALHVLGGAAAAFNIVVVTWLYSSLQKRGLSRPADSED